MLLFLQNLRKCTVFGDDSIDIKTIITSFLQQCDEYKNTRLDFISVTIWKKCEIRRNFIKYEFDVFAGMICI